jgi:hypothetical protein
MHTFKMFWNCVHIYAVGDVTLQKLTNIKLISCWHHFRNVIGKNEPDEKRHYL